MRDRFWLLDGRMRRIEPYFPRSHGVPRVDDRRIVKVQVLSLLSEGLGRSVAKERSNCARRSVTIRRASVDG